MSLLKIVLVVAVLFTAVANGVIKSLPESYRNAYRSKGLATIRAAATADNTRLQDAYNAYVAANSTCQTYASAALTKCGKCVGSRCRQRVAEVCPPTRPTVEPTCSQLKSNSSFYCKYYAHKDICTDCTSGSAACISCVRSSCIARYKSVCPPTRPTVEPTCSQLKSNSSFYCKYYADKNICSACTSGSEACKTCIKDRCVARYKAICPPTRPTVEPVCEELKSNSSFYCRYYADKTICPDCATDKTLCKQCVTTKCKARYLNDCPLNRPTTPPGCNGIKNNASYYCLYYADSSICSGCTDLTSDACKTCIKNKCKARGKSVCSNFLIDTILFFRDDFPNFFESTLPNTFENLGDSIANFGVDALGDIITFGEDIGAGFDALGDLITGIDFAGGIADFGDLALDNVINPIGEGFSDLFTNIIPDIASDIGAGFDIALDSLGDINLGNIGDIVVDFGGLIFNTILDPLGDFFIDFGDISLGDILDPIIGGLGDLGDILGGGLGDLGDIFGGLGNVLGDGADIVGGGLDDLTGGIASGLGSLGKRKKRQAIPEPGCSEIKANPNQVCLYYKDAALCPDCGFTPATGCPGWSEAVTNLKRAVALRKWLLGLKHDQSYNITSVTYNTDNVVPAADYTYTDVNVKLSIFGQKLSFVLPQTLKLTNSTQMGIAIATETVRRARAAAAAA